MPNLSNAKVALVYDRVNKWGGAERVLLALHELFPQAPLFTAVYGDRLAPWARVFPTVIPTFLQKFPWAKSRHELYPWLTPLAFETLRLDGYDIVISVTSADAKGIITKPDTFHLCYCLTPTRYLWSHEIEYSSSLSLSSKLISRPVFNYLKRWDLVASHRPDAYVTISQTVRERIRKYYDLDSEVVYPPVDIEKFAVKSKPIADGYFLWIGRLVAYKRAQLVVETFSELELPLVVIGLGALAGRLSQMAKSNVRFLGYQSDEELARYYQSARALVFFHEEDFGIVPIEAMAAGTPVIGLNRGGVAETVVHGVTGHLLGDSQEELKRVILDWDRYNFDREAIKTHAQRFTKDRFQREFSQALVRAYSRWRRGNSALAVVA